MKIFIFLFSLVVAQGARAMDLDGFLQTVENKHQGIKALNVSQDAALDKKTAGDIGLVPVLTLKGSYLEDKKQPNFFGADSQNTTQYTLGLGKKFSTGTQVNLSANTIETENKGLASPLFAPYRKYSQGSLGVSFSQSLWKDAFGESTRLRREREQTSYEAEKSNYDLQKRQLLVEAETAFWSYIYLKEELTQREESLKRAQKIESWVRRRVNDGIGDRADLLNAQALVASRQLQVLMTQDEVTANTKQLREILELGAEEPLPPLTGKIDSRRDIQAKLKGRVVRLDAYLSELESKTRATVAKETEENVKADLVLAGSYNTNSYEQNGTASDATRNWQSQEHPTSTVSLTWTYLFETSVKDAARTSARKEALAAQLRSQKKARESDLAWQELIRRNEELAKKIEAARVLSRLQIDRAKAEQVKLSKGRSITMNVINSEQDAAEAELNLTKLMAEQRKLEAQTKLFVAVGDQ